MSLIPLFKREELEIVKGNFRELVDYLNIEKENERDAYFNKISDRLIKNDIYKESGGPKGIYLGRPF